MTMPKICDPIATSRDEGEFNACEAAPLGMESLWILVRRFLARNCLRPKEFTIRFRRSQDTHQSSTFDMQAFAEHSGIPLDALRASEPSFWEFGLDVDQSRALHFCPQCVESGLHSVFHDVSWMTRCPIHGCELLRNCPTCNRYLGHTSERRFGDSPETLPCGHPWTDVNVRAAPDVDETVFVMLAQWIKRLKSHAGGERWYGLALNGSDCFGRDREDFLEFCDLVAAVGELPDAVRSAMRNRRFVKTAVLRTTAESARFGWFQRALKGAERELRDLEEVGGLESMLCDDRVLHLDSAIDQLRRVSQQGFVAQVRKKLFVFDIAGRCERVDAISKQLAELAAVVFLQKLLASDRWRRLEGCDQETYLRHAMRLVGQPVGLLRVKNRVLEVFWSALHLRTNKLEIYQLYQQIRHSP